MDDLIKVILGWGPAGVLAAGALYLWREERAERIEAQRALFEIGKRSIEADFTTAKSLDELGKGLDSLVRVMIDPRH